MPQLIFTGVLGLSCFALVHVVSQMSLAFGVSVLAVYYDGRPVTPLWPVLVDFAVFWHLPYYKVSARNLVVLCALEA